MLHTVLRTEITSDVSRRVLVIRDDGTGSEAIGHYDVVLRSGLAEAQREHRARVEYYPRTERTALELVAAAIRALHNQHADLGIL